MNTRTLPKLIVAAAAALMWLLGPGAREVQAYVDPGTGGAIISTIAILLGVFSTLFAFCFALTKRWGSIIWTVVTKGRRSNTETVDEIQD